VAYIAQGGEVLLCWLAGAGLALPAPAGGSVFVAIFGSFLYLADASTVERVNSVFFFIVLASFAVLLVVGLPAVDAARWANSDWSQAFSCFPISILALVFHNIVPVLTTKLRGDRGKIRAAIVIGSAVPLAMFLLWNLVVLGSVDQMASDPLDQLRAGSGGAALGASVSVFSEFAVVTSLFGFFFGQRDVLTDLFGIDEQDRSRDAALALGVLGPPLVVATLAPDLFASALDFAGTFCITSLFGLLPAAIVWCQRYAPAADGGPAAEPFVPGGRWTLGAMGLVSGFVILEGVASAL
jgi:tyrosine-specific transport protein